MGKKKESTEIQHSYAGAKKTVLKKKLVLECLIKHFFNIRRACEEAEIDRSTLYEWREKDDVFKEAYEEAYEEAGDRLEGMADDIAIAGERDSDRLKAIEMRLKARYKSRGYGVEKREQQHSGEVDVNNQVVIVRIPKNGREAPEPEGH